VIPSGWSDDGQTLTAHNKMTVVKGFRNEVLAGGWDADDWPLAVEYTSDSIEPGNPSIGAGSRQDFRKGSLGWTESKGVYRIWVRQDLQAYARMLADARAQIAALQGELQQGEKAEAAVRALKDALAASV
jgi:hypothetical protein